MDTTAPGGKFRAVNRSVAQREMDSLRAAKIYNPLSLRIAGNTSV